MASAGKTALLMYTNVYSASKLKQYKIIAVRIFHMAFHILIIA